MPPPMVVVDPKTLDPSPSERLLAEAAMKKPMIGSDPSGPLYQVLESPRVVTPLHILSPRRDDPYQSYHDFEFQVDEPLPPHRFDTTTRVVVQDPPKEWALDSLKLGGDVSEYVRLATCEEFMSDDNFIHTQEFKQFVIRYLTDHIERTQGIDFHKLEHDEREKLKHGVLTIGNQQFSTDSRNRERDYE